MRMKKLLPIILGMTMSIMLMTGCGNSSNQSEESTQDKYKAVETEADNTTEYPITMKHAFGETIIESKPERIATVGWGNQDTPLALGVVPVGVSAANYGKVTENKLHLWTSDAFTALGEKNPVVFDDLDGFDYEGISDTNPDVILASYSGMTKEEYEMLSEIAPVVPYTNQPWQTTWRDQTIVNATAMGMKEEGEAKVAEVEELIKQKTAEHPELAGTNTAFCWISPDDFSTFYVYLPADPRAAFLTDLGLPFPESVKKMASSDSEFSITVSRENADQLSDIDMMVVYGDESLLSALQKDKLMSQIPAIKNGAVVLLDSTSALAAATTPSILSIPDQIDDYLALLVEAHGKIK
ncbi:MAG TPA: iron-siderophore ABC transporter substrate-binding protein [Candidatus Scybalomonas excrementigallinarum]|nr:iron-siderophore ABC transporter substrate-binding protein [Candidatus Scybalomonas excrementigallinarum]